MGEERLLRDFPRTITKLLKDAKFAEADEQVAKAELKLGQTPNTMAPLRAVTRLHLLAMDLADHKKVDAKMLSAIKADLQKYRTITNGYKAYRELVRGGEGLMKLIEGSTGRILFDKQRKRFSSSRSQSR